MAPKAGKPTAVGKVPRTSRSATSSTTVSTSEKATTSISAKPSLGVAKATSTSATRMKAMPPSSCNVVPLPLSATAKLRQLSESKTSDNSPGKSVSDRRRKKTNTSEISEKEWKIAKVKLTNVKDALAHMIGQGAAPQKHKASMEWYVKQCEKAMQIDKKADL